MRERARDPISLDMFASLADRGIKMKTVSYANEAVRVIVYFIRPRPERKARTNPRSLELTPKPPEKQAQICLRL